ncbi:hypothetical protein MCOR02_001714 [Pyricularia oryzae]|nr:hypothetical protein MCOR02_001714 [Pyricularia oryzae]
MSLRPLRGGCQCGRNAYTVNLPENASELAQVLFDADPRHRIFQASPLAAFLRVPLSWYQSSTFPFFDDERSGAIRRTYTHPAQQASKRNFCGFCGTPLSYWSEDPPSEADFIRLTLGSLCHEDLGDLEELGLVPGPTMRFRREGLSTSRRVSGARWRRMGRRAGIGPIIAAAAATGSHLGRRLASPGSTACWPGAD